MREEFLMRMREFLISDYDLSYSEIQDSFEYNIIKEIFDDINILLEKEYIKGYQQGADDTFLLIKGKK